MGQNFSIVNAPNLYVDGLRITWDTEKLITVSPGAARDSTNSNDITLSAPIILNNQITGPQGLDIGIAGQGMYFVYLIGDSTLYSPTSAVFSLSSTGPQLPMGYNMWRRIGSVSMRQNGPNVFIIKRFKQYGNSQDRLNLYAIAYPVLFQTACAPDTAINLSLAVPPVETLVLFTSKYISTGAIDYAILSQETNVSAAEPTAWMGVGVTGTSYAQVQCGCSVNSQDQAIVYAQNSGLLTLNVAGYWNYL